MTGLKTLKDLTYFKRADGTPCEGHIPDVNELMQDAIKDVKHFMAAYELKVDQLPHDMEFVKDEGKVLFRYKCDKLLEPNDNRRFSIIAYIMWKNNLTAEDLR